MISLEDIRYHHALLQDAILILRSETGDKDTARQEIVDHRKWLSQNDAIGFLLELIDQKESTNGN